MPTELEVVESVRRFHRRINYLHKQGAINLEHRNWCLTEAEIAVNGIKDVQRLYGAWLDPFLFYPRRSFLDCHADARHQFVEPETTPSHVLDLVNLPGGAVQYTIMECAKCVAFRIEYSDWVGKKIGSYKYELPESYMPAKSDEYELPWPSVWRQVQRYVRFLDRINGYEAMVKKELEDGSRSRHATARPVLHAV